MPSRPRKGKHQKSKDDVDRISNLPEPVLSHILSFLPTLQAVATSLVSRKWKFLWTGIHNLRFDDHKFKDKKIKFAHFVSKVLIFLNRKSIENFCLRIEEYYEMYDVSSWIATAVAGNLKELRFYNQDHDSSYDDPHVELPASIFTCKTLEVLELKGKMNVYIPSSACLPNLKTLALESVSFQCVDESFANLISNCPSLTTLFVERDEFDNLMKFSISSHSLKKLFLRFCTLDPPDLEYQLEINAPAVRYFYLCDEISLDFSIENMGLLEEAIIQTKRYIDDKALYPKAVVKLLQGVSNAKHLTFHPCTIKALKLVDTVPSFPRLTHFEAQYCDWNLLLKLAGGMNKLEFLTLSLMDTNLSCQSLPEEPPMCFLTCLQKMSINEFGEEEDELALVAYILKNSKVLKTMAISAYIGLDSEDRNELLEKILKFPRGCEECDITVSSDEPSFWNYYDDDTDSLNIIWYFEDNYFSELWHL